MNTMRQALDMYRYIPLLLLCLALPLRAAPEETWYQVELMVFASRLPDDGEELWRPAPPPDALDSAVPLGELGTLRPVPAKDWELGNLYAAIDRSDLYQALWYQVWRQPGWNRNDAVPIRVAAGATDMEGHSVLEGTLRLYRGRYLHLQADLRYADPELGPGEGFEPLRVALRQSRRMRSGELHYLDHPRLGVLVRVTPVESD